MDQHRINLPSALDQNFGLCISPQDLLLPHYNFPMPFINYYRPWKCYNMQKPRDFGSTICDEKDKFKICLDVQHFQPSEINVKVTNNEIIIEGDHKERKDSHGFISRRFKRRYILPKDCNADSVISTLSSDGVLIVIADKARDQRKTEIIVPIQICSKTATKEKAKPEPDLKSKLVVESIKQEVVKDKTVNAETDKKKTADSEADKKKTAIMLKEDHCRLLKPELLGEAAAATLKKMSVPASTAAGAADLFSLNTEMCSKVNAQCELKTEERCKLSNAQSDQKTEVKSELSSAPIGQKKGEKSELSSAQSVQKTEAKFELSSAQSGQKTELSSAQSGQKTEAKSELSSAQSGQKTEAKSELKEKSSASASKFETMESIAGASRQTESCSIKNMVSETIEVQQSSSSYSSSMSSSFQETTAKINELVGDISAQLKEAAENI